MIGVSFGDQNRLVSFSRDRKRPAVDFNEHCAEAFQGLKCIVKYRFDLRVCSFLLIEPVVARHADSQAFDSLFQSGPKVGNSDICGCGVLCIVTGNCLQQYCTTVLAIGPA